MNSILLSNYSNYLKAFSKDQPVQSAIFFRLMNVLTMVQNLEDLE